MDVLTISFLQVVFFGAFGGVPAWLASRNLPSVGPRWGSYFAIALAGLVFAMIFGLQGPELGTFWVGEIFGAWAGQGAFGSSAQTPGRGMQRGGEEPIEGLVSVPSVFVPEAADEIAFYEQINRELKGSGRNEAVWLKARVEADGDKGKAEIAYAKLRMQTLKAQAAVTPARSAAPTPSSATKPGYTKPTAQPAAQSFDPNRLSEKLFEILQRNTAPLEGEPLTAVRKLIEEGVLLDRRNSKGETALFVAARAGLPLIVKVLLDSGADPEIPDNQGVSPRDAAQDRGLSKVSRLLPAETARAKNEGARVHSCRVCGEPTQTSTGVCVVCSGSAV